MAKFLIALSFIFISWSAAASNCELEIKPGLCVEVQFAEKITRNKSADFKIYFRDKKTQELVLPKEKVFPYLWMVMKNGHGHGSDPLKIDRMNDHFRVTNAWFLMLGSWQLHIQLRVKGTKVYEVVKDICVARGDEACK